MRIGIKEASEVLVKIQEMTSKGLLNETEIEKALLKMQKENNELLKKAKEATTIIYSAFEMFPSLIDQYFVRSKGFRVLIDGDKTFFHIKSFDNKIREIKLTHISYSQLDNLYIIMFHLTHKYNRNNNFPIVEDHYFDEELCKL